MTSMLEQLPDELILEVFSYLRPVRKVDFESIHHPTWDSEEAQELLASLCLTSKRLSNIAIPLLFSDAFTSALDGDTPDRISKLLTTIMRNPVRCDQIEYIEHQVAICSPDHCGPDHCMLKTYHDSRFWKKHCRRLGALAATFWSIDNLMIWKEMLQLYSDEAQLILLMKMAKNVAHVYIHMIGHALEKCLKLLSPTSSGQDSSVKAPCLAQLQKVFIFIEQDDDRTGRSPEWCAQLAGFLQVLPSLHCYASSELRCYGGAMPTVPVEFRLLKLKKLSFLNTHIPLNVVASFVEACENLRDFAYEPNACSRDDTSFDILYSALLSRKDTLEQLWLRLAGGSGRI